MSGLGKKLWLSGSLRPQVHVHVPVQTIHTVVPTPGYIPPQPPTAPVEFSSNEPFVWLSTSIHYCDHLLHKAVQAGHEGHDGSPIYIGRTHYDGELIPCKVIPRHRAAYAPYNGKEISVLNFELYCRQTPRLDWVPASHGSIPPGAVVGGHSKGGETLYVGRASYNGSVTPGKVHCSHRCLYISFGGNEIPIHNYEVAVINFS